MKWEERKVDYQIMYFEWSQISYLAWVQLWNYAYYYTDTLLKCKLLKKDLQSAIFMWWILLHFSLANGSLTVVPQVTKGKLFNFAELPELTCKMQIWIPNAWDCCTVQLRKKMSAISVILLHITQMQELTITVILIDILLFLCSFFLNVFLSYSFFIDHPTICLFKRYFLNISGILGWIVLYY